MKYEKRVNMAPYSRLSSLVGRWKLVDSLGFHLCGMDVYKFCATNETVQKALVPCPPVHSQPGFAHASKYVASPKEFTQRISKRVYSKTQRLWR